MGVNTVLPLLPPGAEIKKCLCQAQNVNVAMGAPTPERHYEVSVQISRARQPWLVLVTRFLTSAD